MVKALLIDTSVWIDFLNGKDTKNVQTLSSSLENDSPIFICPVIIQEILQGIKNDSEFDNIKECLFALNVLNDDSLEVALGAANLYRNLRKKGITIRKSNDCQIAYYAIKYNLKILHEDRDFDNILI